LRSEGLRSADADLKAPFPAAEPKDGQARFRPSVELGKSNGLPVNLAQGPAMWLRVMPAFDPEKRWLGTELKDLASPSDNFLKPLGIEAFLPVSTDHVFSEDGFGIYVHRQPTPCVAYVFKTGEIWGVDAYHLGIGNVIPLIEPYFIEAFQGYAAFLRDKLGVPLPYQWIAGIEGVKGRPIQIPLAPNQVVNLGARGSCLSDTIAKGGTHLEGANPQASLRPFFVELYDMCTVSRPNWMDGFAWPSMRY
jgi:hypothetical protein